MEVERYEHGVPAWVDLGTPDIPGAIEFYSGLFGWQIELHAVPNHRRSC